MKIDKDQIHARIGGCYELKPTCLHQRHIVRKSGWVTDIKSYLSNAPADRRWWTWQDEDGDGHLLIVWKDAKCQ